MRIFLPIFLILFPLTATSQQMRNLSVTQELKLPAEATSRALYLGVSGEVRSSATVDATELGYLDGVTSSIQTQFSNHESDTTPHSTITGASIQSPTRLDPKKDTLANLEAYAATAQNGEIVFATDEKETYKVVDGALEAMGGGAGGGDAGILLNSDFEDGTTSWTLTAGTAVEETTAGNFIKGAKSYKATLSAQTLALYQDSTSFAAAFANGVNSDRKIWVKTTVSGVYVCPRNAGSTILSACATVDSSGSWLEYNAPYVLGGTSNGLAVVSGTLSSGVVTPGAITGDVYVDYARVGLSERIGTSSIITPWQSYTPTVTGFGTTTPASPTMYWRQNGSSIEVEGSWVNGVVAASIASISLPNGYTIDSSKLTRSNTTSNPGPIIGSYNASAANSSGSIVTATGTSTSVVYFGVATTGAATQTPQNGNGVGPNSASMAVRFSVPIANLSGSTQVFSSQCGASCADLLRADVSAAGVVSGEDIEFINGNAAVTDTSLFTFTFTSGIFTVAPKCWAEMNLTALAYGTQRDSVSSSAVAIRTYNDAGAKSAQPFTIWCTKSGADYISSRTIVGSFKRLGDVAVLSDVKSAGTNGGSCTSGSWITRTLNTESDPNEIVSLSSNQFTLSAGRYEIIAHSPCYNTDSFRSKIRNITDSTDDILGSTTYTNSGGNSKVVGNLTVTGTKVFELQNRCQTTNADGFGIMGISVGTVETYGQVLIRRLSP